MIVDKIEDYLRAAKPPDPALVARVQRLMGTDGWDSFRRNFIDFGRGGVARKPVTLSSHFYCARHIHYDLEASPKEPPAPRAFLAFRLGDEVELMTVGLAIVSGVDVLWPTADGEQKAVSADFGGDILPGHIDMVIRHQGEEIPVEIKSMSEYGWEKSKREGVEDTFGYVGQLQNYIAAIGAKRGLFVGINKSTGHPFEQEILADPAHVAAMRAAYAEAKNGLPPRPAWATIKDVRAPGGAVTQIDSVRCGYCGHRAVCWPGYEMQVVSGKPVYRRPVESKA